MTTTMLKSNPSVNILRDAEVNFNYIPTSNSDLIFKQITEAYASGAKRSFSIIGSYGTGKSAFLWALRQTLSRRKKHFSTASSLEDTLPVFDFLPLVGEYDSFMSILAKKLNLSEKDITPRKIFPALDEYYQQLSIQHKGLVIVVDEFGKFLEYAAQHNPEKELYFVQQLAEWANDGEKNILFIITLHQGFDAYAIGLEKSQRNEWDKVKGRLKELTFNEPIEQLLALAARRLEEGAKIKPLNFDKLFEAIDEAKAFPLQSYFDKQTAQKLLPFDILSASVLTIALQKYGQNERSLFSFIEGNEFLSIRDFNMDANPYYNVSCVYDYLTHHYHNFISSKHNSHFTQWAAIRGGLERLEGLSLTITDMETARKLIKTIGLLNIFAPASAKIDLDFLTAYGKHAMGINSSKTVEILRCLDKSGRIIAYRKHSQRYRFQGDSDLDIELAISQAGELITQVTGFVGKLNDNFNLSHVLAKSHYFNTGTPRFFKFRLTEEPVFEIPTGTTDGFVNLIFSEKVSVKEIQKISEEQQEAILYGCYNEISQLRNILLDIEKVKKVIGDNQDDRIAVRELNGILNHYQKLLTSKVLGSLYSGNGNLTWFYRGEKLVVTNEKDFNRRLSRICDTVYEAAPRIHFEMINKTKLSGAMLGARSKLMKNLTENFSREDLGFEADKFPPEKSIYLTLLQRTGIHRANKTGAFLSSPTEESMQKIWLAGEEFLRDSKSGKRNIAELLDILSKRPYKVKKGLLDFWLPVFLFVKKDDFALFGDNGYIPNLTYETLELLVKDPNRYSLKAFDIEGVRLDLFKSYREMMDQSQELHFSNGLFVETIKPFLVFYKNLPEYAKRTKRLPDKALQLRQAIATAKDPEKSFFEDFPAVLGYTMLDLQRSPDELADYIPALQNAIREIRTAFDQLLRRFEKCLQERIFGSEEITFPAYKDGLQKRYRKIKKHLLRANEKTFLQRVNSAIDDRQSWLISIAEACLGKNIEQMTDEEEMILMDNLQTLIYNLDQLNDVAIGEADEKMEIVINLDVTILMGDLKNYKDSIRLPKHKQQQMETIEQKIDTMLSKEKNMDKSMRIAILAKLLQSQKTDK